MAELACAHLTVTQRVAPPINRLAQAPQYPSRSPPEEPQPTPHPPIRGASSVRCRPATTLKVAPSEKLTPEGRETSFRFTP
jgi:hypothetical protein